MWNSSTEVAIKTLKQGAMSPSAFLEEARIMKKLRHRNILVLYAVCTKEEPILIVTEYMCNGALLDLLRNEGERTLKLNDLIYVATQVSVSWSIFPLFPSSLFPSASQSVHLNLLSMSYMPLPFHSCFFITDWKR